MKNTVSSLRGLKLFLVIVSALLLTSLAGCSGNEPAGKPAKVTAADTTQFKYMCVHECPGGFSNEPGKCPACGMDMFEVSKLKAKK